MNRKKYDREFKLNAIKLSEESKMKARDLEKELGIGSGCLSHWKKEFEKENGDAFPGNGNPKEKENFELRKRVADLELDREILKKAIAIFSGVKK
jgi:transposase